MAIVAFIGSCFKDSSLINSHDYDDDDDDENNTLKKKRKMSVLKYTKASINPL
jgi:hypothetical protein